MTTVETRERGKDMYDNFETRLYSVLAEEKIMTTTLRRSRQPSNNDKNEDKFET